MGEDPRAEWGTLTFRVPAYQVIGCVAMTVDPVARSRVWVAATTLDCLAREFRILDDVSLSI